MDGRRIPESRNRITSKSAEGRHSRDRAHEKSRCDSRPTRDPLPVIDVKRMSVLRLTSSRQREFDHCRPWRARYKGEFQDRAALWLLAGRIGRSADRDPAARGSFARSIASIAMANYATVACRLCGKPVIMMTATFAARGGRFGSRHRWAK